MPKFVAIVLAILVTCLASLACADSVDEELQRLESEAAAAYAAGEYQTAINLVVRANQIRPHANNLLNIAVSYTKLGDCENAVLWANAALEATLPAEARPAAEAVLDQCAPAPDLKGPNNGVGANNGAGNNGGPGPEKPSEAMSADMIWGLSLLGTGLLTIGLDAVLLDIPTGDAKEKAKARNLRGGFATEKEYSDRKDELQLNTLLAIAIYVVGTAVAVTGAALITMDLLDEGDAPPATGWRIAPTVTPDGAAVQLGVSW